MSLFLGQRVPENDRVHAAYNGCGPGAVSLFLAFFYLVLPPSTFKASAAAACAAARRAVKTRNGEHDT